MKYLKLLGVALEPMESSSGAALYHLRGKRVLLKQGNPVDWPLELRADEKGRSRAELWSKYVAPVLRELGDLESVGWPPASLNRFDRISFTEFLRQQGASPGATEILKLGLADQLGDGADTTSALNLLREAALRATLKQAFFSRLFECIGVQISAAFFFWLQFFDRNAVPISKSIVTDARHLPRDLNAGQTGFELELIA